MSNIFEKFDKKVSLKYYGIDDMSTGINIKILLDDFEKIHNYFENYDYNIINFNKYIDFLFIEQAINYKELIGYINQENEENLKIFLNFVDSEIIKYKKGDEIKYINKEYKNIFNVKHEDCNLNIHEIEEATINIILKKIGGIEKCVINWLIENKTILIYDHIEEFFSYLCNELKYGDLLGEMNIVKVIKYRNEKLWYLIFKLKDKNIDVDTYVDRIVKTIKKDYFNSNVERSIETQMVIKYTLNHLKKIDSIYTYDFEEELERQNVLINKYIEQYGKKTNIPISIESYIKFINDEKIPLELKIILITHHKGKDKNIVDFFSYAVNYCQKGLIDILASTNIDNNKYFTISTIQNIEIFFMASLKIMYYWLNDADRTNEWISMLLTFTNDIIKKNSREISDNYFQDDYNILSVYIRNIFYSDYNNDNNLKKSDIYGASIFICGLIEKILRIIYIEENKDKTYIKSNKTTLGVLLDENNDIISSILGKDNSRCIRYFLHTDYDGNIGKNIRNKLAHLSDNILDELNENLILQLLVLLTDVINSTYIYYEDKPIK